MPETDPDRLAMFAERRANHLDPQLLETWRAALTGDDHSDPSDIALQELSEYFSLPVDEVRRRCVHWEDDSVQEWNAKDRSTPEGLLDFYQTQVSWIFDTVWYHAEQYHGRNWAESIEIVQGLREMDTAFAPGRHLDFGAGPGSSSLFFHELGWDVSLADISTTMLDYARWRFARHGVSAVFYDLTQNPLPDGAFDLITAFDVMVHVPDVRATLAQLHRALKPGGYLVFNIDNLPKTDKTQWHLYADQYPILRQVRSAGFRRHPKIIFFHVFQKVAYPAPVRPVIRAADTLRYNAVVAGAGKIARRLKSPGRP